MKESTRTRPRKELSSDGSHTLFSTEFDAHYHSTHGAIQESKHVFIEAGLKRCKQEELKVIEIGLGTGLNALLTLMETLSSSIKVDYHAYEAYPISTELAAELNYCSLLEVEHLREAFLKMHVDPSMKKVAIAEDFHLSRYTTSFLEADFPPEVDLVYFDAFGPGTQPELWEAPLFENLYAVMNPGGILTTYCSKGDVRRTMIAIGFQVEKIPGPPGKREMLVAIK
jgi:tRNA U34 5-methylaminomethyl-2-thiouridine-forming methyltransferase MnmC